MIDPARPAARSDREPLVSMVRRAWDEAVGQRGGPQFARERGPLDGWIDRFDELVDGEDSLLLVGGIDGVPLGFSLAQLRRFGTAETVVELPVLYTEPEARSVGIAAGLMDSVASWARDRGAVGLDASVLPGNRSAKNFFESYGMKARLIQVHRRLDDDG